MRRRDGWFPQRVVEPDWPLPRRPASKRTPEVLPPATEAGNRLLAIASRSQLQAALSRCDITNSESVGDFASWRSRRGGSQELSHGLSMLESFRVRRPSQQFRRPHGRRNDPHRRMLVRRCSIFGQRFLARDHRLPLLAVPPHERTSRGRHQRACGKPDVRCLRSIDLVSLIAGRRAGILPSLRR